ncbi:MAG: uroporphyrinogen-III C-methyltransferase [Candidatus Omnitrophota bacterium]|nr:uroporphyrinogen-III C-methyltransferase [Candidatus Omnitrophota bacterium]
MSKSKVYLVGAGPGDCSLITVRGLELIKTADCIIYDYLANPGLLRFRKNDCELVYAGKKAGAHTLPQSKINRLLADKAKIHRSIVRLKGGDPFIFGRGAEEALYLQKKRINFEIVPGVTSAIAVPAYAGIPLTVRSINSSVGFVTGHLDPANKTSRIDWPALAKGLETIVFLMGVSNLSLIVKNLIACGKPKHTPVALIRWGTTTRQQTIVGNLGNIVKLAEEAQIGPPAIIVVGEVVNLRKQLSWFENKPLFGKRIMITRPEHQLSVLAEKLIQLGAEVMEAAAIKIISLKADKQLTSALSSRQYDWIFFTSQNGVLEFFSFLERAGKDLRILGKAKICCIGPKTKESLEEKGIKADFVPRLFYAEALVKHFKQPEFRGKSVLLLRAKQARDVLARGLSDAGMSLKVIDLYDTCIEKESVLKIKEALKEGIDLLTFTSSSTVKNLIRLLGKDYRRKLSGVRLASIGPITSGTLKEFGLKQDVQAKVFTIDGLVEAIIKSND